MIEINLSPVAKAQDFTKIGPINLSMINLPLLVISIFIYTFGEGLVEGYFTDDIEKTEKMFQIKNKEYRTLSQGARFELERPSSLAHVSMVSTWRWLFGVTWSLLAMVSVLISGKGVERAR